MSGSRARTGMPGVAVRRTFAWSFCVGALFAAMSSFLSAQDIAAPTERYRPFTAEVATTYFYEQGDAKVFSGRFFRKSDGSYARIEESEANGGERGTVRYILDAPTRTWVDADTFVNAALVMRRSESEFRRLMLSEGGCEDDPGDVDSKRVGESEKLGMRTVEIESQVSPNLITRRWVAPDLQCFELLNLLIEKGEVRTKKEVLSVQFGEPDPEPFRVPAGYRIVDPSQYEELWKKKYNGRDYFGEKALARLQREYEEGRAAVAGSAIK